MSNELSRFGKALDEGENPEIERGGTLAPPDGRGHHGRGHGRPENPGEEHRRKPPHGRSHALL